LLFCSAPLVIRGQSGSGGQGASTPQPQASATSPHTDRSSPQSKSKSSERIFGVVPAYNITDARNAPPLTPTQKFELFSKATLDPFPVAAYAFQAGVSQASDTHSGYGQGLAGYGKRFGAALLDGTSARFFCTYAFPSLLHQDPRYFRKGEGSSWSRVGYSVTRGFVTRAEDSTELVQHVRQVCRRGSVKSVLSNGGSRGKSDSYPSGHQPQLSDAGEPRNRILARDPQEAHEQEVEVKFGHDCPRLSSPRLDFLAVHGGRGHPGIAALWLTRRPLRSG
jgi:hypothetical protein